jgi:MFS family permease
MTDIADAPNRCFMPYKIYRWVVCFAVMIALIPMAGTMTSFGGIKTAIQRPMNCTEYKATADNTPVPLNVTTSPAGKQGKSFAGTGVATESTKQETLYECVEWTEDESGFIGYGEAIRDEETGLWTLSPPAMISLVGSLVFGFTVGSSVVTSPIVAKIGYRYSGLVGVALGMVVSIATSYTTNFYIWFLTYSFLFGVANNMVYNTGMQMCNAFFPTDYNTAATVIGSFGISLGTVVMTPVSVYVTDNFGFRNRFRVAAMMQAAMTLPAVLLWGQPHQSKSEKEGEQEANKDEKPTEETELVTENAAPEEEDNFNLCMDISFWCWLFGTTFWSLDFVIPLDFAIDFMTDNGMERSTAGSVMSALGIAELLSRVVCAVTGEQKYLTKATIYILTSAVGAASCILPIVAYQTIPTDENGERLDGESISATIMFTYAIIVGFCAGVLNCLIMACTVEIFGQKRTVQVWNYVSIMLGVGFVGGPPIGQWFTTQVVDDLVYVFYLAVAFFALCSIVMLPIPIIMRRNRAAEDRAAENRDNREDGEYYQAST